MTLDETIARAEEVAEENQRVVDTGIVFNDVTIDMLYCDDTEVIEKHLANYQKRAEEYRQLAEWLKDYKRLKEQEPCEDVISRQAVLDEAFEVDTSVWSEDAGGERMTLDEAIEHEEEVAEINQAIADNTDDDNWMDIAQCEKCAAEHKQLAGWLKDYKRLKEQGACDDAISKQAVIDAFHTWFRDGFDEDKWWNSTHVLAAIEGIPSVHQKHKWETCFECPLSHGCPKIKGCTNEQAVEYASKIPNDCPLSAQPERKTDGDTISRQAVHEAIVRWAGSMSVLVALPTRETIPLLDSIHKLPSVNPQPKTEWIPVSERLPEDGRPVLIYAWNVHHVIARYDEFRTANGYKKTWVTADAWNGNTEINHEVIAWMPLPSPLEPQESEE